MTKQEFYENQNLIHYRYVPSSIISRQNTQKWCYAMFMRDYKANTDTSVNVKRATIQIGPLKPRFCSRSAANKMLRKTNPRPLKSAR
jgi:hypothetical protein